MTTINVKHKFYCISSFCRKIKNLITHFVVFSGSPWYYHPPHGVLIIFLNIFYAKQNKIIKFCTDIFTTDALKSMQYVYAYSLLLQTSWRFFITIIFFIFQIPFQVSMLLLIHIIEHDKNGHRFIGCLYVYNNINIFFWGTISLPSVWKTDVRLRLQGKKMNTKYINLFQHFPYTRAFSVKMTCIW